MRSTAGISRSRRRTESRTTSPRSSTVWRLTPTSSATAGSTTRGTLRSTISSVRRDRAADRQIVAIDQKPVCTRRGDDGVDGVEDGGQGVERDDRGTGFPSGLDRVMCRPAGHEQAADATLPQAVERLTASLARADDQDGATLERSPFTLEKRHGGSRRRDRALADSCFGTRTAARAQDARSHALEHGTNQASPTARRDGTPDLSRDLGFTDDQRVEAGSDASEMQKGRSTDVDVDVSGGLRSRTLQRALSRGPPRPVRSRGLAEARVVGRQNDAQLALGRTNVVSDRHDFHAMARREDEQFSDARWTATSQRGRSSSQAAANIHGRGAMTRADEKEIHFALCPLPLCPS